MYINISSLSSPLFGLFFSHSVDMSPPCAAELPPPPTPPPHTPILTWPYLSVCSSTCQTQQPLAGAISCLPGSAHVLNKTVRALIMFNLTLRHQEGTWADVGSLTLRESPLASWSEIHICSQLWLQITVDFPPLRL